MTFASLGGPAGAGGDGAAEATAAARSERERAPAKRAVAGDADAAGSPARAGETTFGGASFEQAAPTRAHVASPTATGAEAIHRGVLLRPTPAARQVLRFDRDLELLAKREVLLADAEEHDFLHALLGGHAGSVFGGAHHLGRGRQVVREQEPGAVGGQVDCRDPLLQVDGARRTAGASRPCSPGSPSARPGSPAS